MIHVQINKTGEWHVTNIVSANSSGVWVSDPYGDLTNYQITKEDNWHYLNENCGELHAEA